MIWRLNMNIGALLYIITRLMYPCSSFLAVKESSTVVTPIRSYYQHDNEVCKSKSNSHESGNNNSKSIGDVVQNLHGGKYQFSSEPQYLAGGSVIGQQFAESLYSSSPIESDCYVGEDVIENVDEESGELPKWANRLQTYEEQSTKPIRDTLIFSTQHRYQSHTITITNDERSWEKFYAFILPPSPSIGHSTNNNISSPVPFSVSPSNGTLAPRGGASNICDETKPYLDYAKISIERIGDAVNDKDEWLLVVGTEAEVWRYRLDIKCTT